MSAASLARNQKRLDRLKHQLIRLDTGIKKLQGQCDKENRYRWLKGAERICRISLNAICLKRDRSDIPRLEREDQAANTYETYEALFLAQHRVEQCIENLRTLCVDPNYALLKLPKCLIEADVNAELEDILKQIMDLEVVNLGATDQMESLLLERKQLLTEIEKCQQRIDKNL